MSFMTRIYRKCFTGMGFSMAVVVCAALAVVAAPLKADGGSKIPEPLGARLAEGDRLLDPGYAALAFGTGLVAARGLDLYEVVSRANDAGDLHKALYFARLLTEKEPTRAAVWDNRAKIAVNLGLENEARECTANAARVRAGDVAKDVTPSFVPGGFPTVEPSSLEDWAAQIALIADDSVAAADGKNYSVAVRNTLSGVVPSANATACTATPLIARDIVPNLLVVSDAKPFRQKSHALAIVASSLLTLGAQAGVAKGMDASATSALGKASGQVMAMAFSRKSEIKAGKYTVLKAKKSGRLDEVKKVKPRTCGTYDAVDIPHTILWATGPARTPTIEASFAVRGKMIMTRFASGSGKVTRSERRDPGELLVPKLAVLASLDDTGRSAMRTTEPLSLFEVMLTEEDARALGASPKQAQGFRQNSWVRQAFEHGVLSIGANFSQSEFIGFDPDDGSIYVLPTSARSWLLTPDSM